MQCCRPPWYNKAMAIPTAAKADSDWIVFYGICTGYALGPYSSGAGGPYGPSLGQFTDHPQQAIGWPTREEAERIVALVGHTDARVVQRCKAIAKWEKGVGRGMEAADWGTSWVR